MCGYCVGVGMCPGPCLGGESVHVWGLCDCCDCVCGTVCVCGTHGTGIVCVCGDCECAVTVYMWRLCVHNNFVCSGTVCVCSDSARGGTVCMQATSICGDRVFVGQSVYGYRVCDRTMYVQ